MLATLGGVEWYYPTLNACNNPSVAPCRLRACLFRHSPNVAKAFTSDASNARRGFLDPTLDACNNPSVATLATLGVVEWYYPTLNACNNPSVAPLATLRGAKTYYPTYSDVNALNRI